MQRHEVRRGRQLFVKRLAQRERDIDQIGEQLWAEHGPHAPEAENGRPLRTLNGPQAAVEIGQARRGRIEQVRSVLLKGGEAVGRVTVEDTAHSAGTKSILWASQVTLSARSSPATKCAVPRTEAGRAAVGRVDVQPDLVPAADVRYVVQWIEGPDRRRAVRRR